MEFQKAMQQLKSKTVPAVMTIYGTEYYLQQSLIRTLESCYEEGQCEVIRLDAEQEEWDMILDEAEMFSFFAEKRVIIVDNAMLLATQSKQKLLESTQKRFVDYVENPNEMTVLVLMLPYNQLDQRKKLTKLLQQKSLFVDVTPLDEKEVERYVTQHLAYHTLNMTKDAQQELLQRVHYQLSDAMNELQKVEHYALDGDTVTKEIIQKLVPQSLESDVFELTKAILERKLQRTTSIYRDLIRLKHEPIALHALIVSQFRLMLQAKISADIGYSQADIAKQLGVHPYRVKLATQSVRHLSISQLSDIYQLLFQADYAMKRSQLSTEVAFDLLVMQIIQKLQTK